jgi:hypothetical protein
LVKPDGTQYRIVFGPDSPDGSCDCAHSCFRGVVCKHLAAVRAALDWLEQAERDEWAVAIAAVPGAVATDKGVPF